MKLILSRYAGMRLFTTMLLSLLIPAGLMTDFQTPYAATKATRIVLML